MLEQLGGVVVYARVAPQLQGRDAVLGRLGEEVHGEEPSGEGLLGGLEEGAGEQAERAVRALDYSWPNMVTRTRLVAVCPICPLPSIRIRKPREGQTCSLWPLR